MAGTDEQAFDNILREVAKRTKKDKQIDDLGGALNIPSYDIEPARDKNKQDNSHMGSLDLLRDWAKTQSPSTMRQTLIDALTKLKRNDILGVCFPVVVADTGTEPTKRNPSPTPGLTVDPTVAGQSHFSPSPGDSSGKHGEGGPSHHSLSPDDKWQDRTVRPAKAGPDESDREMQYVMWESLVKGNALIIGNADFPPPGKSRPRAYDDISNMKGLLKKLGYDSIDIHRNLSKMGMRDTVKEFTEQLKKDNPQSAVVYISSHGNEKGVQGSKGGILQIRDLLEMFSGVLLGKPKVLIIDACWGGKTSWSDLHKGSWFVEKLCEVIYNNDRDLEDLDTIMLRVTTGVHKIESTNEDDGKDAGTQSTTVFKQGVGRKLFFYPGYPPTNV